ncbi:MAG: hypothetical protein OXB89_05995 [Anaerolineaceae bacterium]|nr:hypothetical protein [Anaerolineaceae bacterium]
MPPALLITSLLHSLQVGSLYALMALGITLTMRVIRLPNFAHAEFVTTGAFTALVVTHFLSRFSGSAEACLQDEETIKSLPGAGFSGQSLPA